MTKPASPAWVTTELTYVDQAVARGHLEQSDGVCAIGARYDPAQQQVVVALANGATFSFPPELAQGLANASVADLSDIELTPQGTGLHWPRLDADLTVEGLLAGLFGSRSWMRAHAAKAGSVKSAAKTQAARVNGAKGGRPRKTTA